MAIERKCKALILTSLLTMTLSMNVQAHDQVSDSIITSKVKSKIVLNKILSVFKVSVTTDNGIVHLSGKLDSDTQAAALVQLTQSTIGVEDVDVKDLKIRKSTQPFTDTLITAKIKGMYIRDKLLGNNAISASNISVETNNGIVFLKGNAFDQTQVENAIALAKMVRGVKDVKSDIAVEVIN